MKLSKYFFAFSLIITGLISACTDAVALPGLLQPAATASVVFTAASPTPLEETDQVYLEVLDEITGINLNPKRYAMQPIDAQRFTINMSFPAGSLVHYRYYKDGENASVEKDVSGQPIEYRVVLVDGAEKADDRVASWSGATAEVYSGEISGYIYDEGTKAPLGEILVFINGLRSVTSHDGFYQFRHLPPGQYNLTAVHPDGVYRTFQQKATLAENSITPASFGMKPSDLITVTFDVELPEETPDLALVRLLGNTFSMGNTFAVLADGSSVIPSRAPQLTRLQGQRYTLSLQLPTGFDLRYKYSLGNGLINAEHGENGEFVTRQLIVPSRNTTIRDEVISWRSSASASASPVQLDIRVPATTNPNDTVSIQFNPFAWMEAFPIWKKSDAQWEYIIFSPLEYLNNAQFRFCLNDQCGIADDQMSKGVNSPGYALSHEGNLLTDIHYEVEKWAWTDTEDYSLFQADFSQPHQIVIKGFALSDQYDMNWRPYLPSGVIDAGVAGANWMIAMPGWTFENQPVIKTSINWKENPSSQDLLFIQEQANQADIDFVLFPQPFFPVSINEYWAHADLTYSGWEKWFADYEQMVLNYADYAQKEQISAIIIGGNKVSPAFPNGFLPDGSPSNSPYNSAEKWASIVEDVRSKFNGQIGFALPSSVENINELVDVIQNCDFVYLQMDTPVYDTLTLGMAEMQESYERIFDQEIYQLYAALQKPMILGVHYYAIPGSGSDCQNTGYSCQHLYLQSLATAQIEANVIEQADLYQAMLRTAVEKPWISGIISEGYNPVVSNQDASSSVRGKPAMQVIRYFFTNLN